MVPWCVRPPGSYTSRGRVWREQKAIYKPDAPPARALVLNFWVSRSVRTLLCTSRQSVEVGYSRWNGLESLLYMEPSASGGKEPCEPCSRIFRKTCRLLYPGDYFFEGLTHRFPCWGFRWDLPVLFSFQGVFLIRGGAPVPLIHIFLSFLLTSVHIFLPAPAFPQHSAPIPLFAFTCIFLVLNSQCVARQWRVQLETQMTANPPSPAPREHQFSAKNVSVGPAKHQRIGEWRGRFPHPYRVILSFCAALKPPIIRVVEFRE